MALARMYQFYTNSLITHEDRHLPRHALYPLPSLTGAEQLHRRRLPRPSSRRGRELHRAGGQELGDASMRGPGFGACDEVTNGACVLTESSEGDCVIHLYSDSSCATPITGGNTITCGDPFENVNFNSFQVECA
ncbi:hypothetical protein B0H14DRAFT_3468479 [Mycena olivaceomarginata]|nr:hypothetical protein B0H14DRAFT_3468479 [Mycena olivaceomarginata]